MKKFTITHTNSNYPKRAKQNSLKRLANYAKHFLKSKNIIKLKELIFRKFSISIKL
jgi:hypothetical protein